MAIGAQARSFRLYSLKTLGDMKEEMKRKAEICPVKDVGSLLSRQELCLLMLIL